MTKREEIQQCLDRIKALTAELTDRPEPDTTTKVEVGKVYINIVGAICYVTKIVDEENVLGYGFVMVGKWIGENEKPWRSVNFTPVPLSEWTELLDKERIKRGLVAGAKIEKPESFRLKGAVVLPFNNDGFRLDSDQEGFYNNVQIYQNGIWAKVIKDEDIYVNGEKVVFGNSAINIGKHAYSKHTLRFAHSLDRETFDKIVGRLG